MHIIILIILLNDYSHELMLWQIIDGRLFKNPYPAALRVMAQRGHPMWV